MKFSAVLSPAGWELTPEQTSVAIANARLPSGITPFVSGDAHGTNNRLLAIEHAVHELGKTDGNRRRLYEVQKAIASLPDVDMPLQHVFAPGVYLRTIFIPAGTVLVGKIHKHKHGNILSKGKAILYTEHGGVEHWEGPITAVSEPGTKRAVYAVTDVYWTTVHLNPTDTQDLRALEDDIIAETYEEYESWVAAQGKAGT